MITVMTAKGKNQTVDYMTIDIFNNKNEAEEYIKSVNTGYRKNWVNAEIIYPGVQYETYELVPEKDI